jgi:hypothetical protein
MMAGSAYAKTDITAEEFKLQFQTEFARQNSLEHAQFERARAFLKEAGYSEISSALEENLDIYATGCSEVSPRCEDRAFTYKTVYERGDRRAVLLEVGGVAIHPRSRKLLLIHEQAVKLCFDEACDPIGLNSDLKN